MKRKCKLSNRCDKYDQVKKKCMTQVQKGIIKMNESIKHPVSALSYKLPHENENGTYNCKLHWGKKVYDVEVDPDESLAVFKTQVFAITGVDPQRQKIILNGRILKDDYNMKTEIKTSKDFCMVGTNEVIVMPVVIEERSNVNKVVSRLPPFGLKNYGNTCYMNSSLQLIRFIPELKELIFKNLKEPTGAEREVLETVLVRNLSELYRSLDQRSENYERFMKEFINNVEILFPEYGGSIEKGGRPQQDANEFLIRILDILKRNLYTEANQTGNVNYIDLYFGIEFEKSESCAEIKEESTHRTREFELHFTCNITVETRFLQDCIKAKLCEIIHKRSEQLNKEVDFTINRKFSRLPAYLCVQYVRFFYKEQEKINAKILKDVKFPHRLDLSESCTNSLKERLKPMHTLVREFESKLNDCDSETGRKVLYRKQDCGIISLPEQGLSIGESGSGIYNLTGVITHEGRTTNSGHYVAWVRLEDRKWAKLDDSVVSFVDGDDILKLSGGGEAHSAYLLVYQSYKIPKR